MEISSEELEKLMDYAYMRGYKQGKELPKPTPPTVSPYSAPFTSPPPYGIQPVGDRPQWGIPKQ